MPIDAFMILIKGVNINDLDNLCKKLEQIYPQLNNFPDGAYRVTQGELNILEVSPAIIKMSIYNSAMECLKEGRHLGNKTIADGKINTSSWISHSLYEAELAANLASILGADSNKAKTLAILHDYGRKVTHSFEHVPRGFEELVNMGWEDEAVATLTHSFLNGGRCANCDPAEEGFYLDEEGNPQWRNDEEKDDVARFLEGYRYSIYDEILNVADLMATDRGIVTPSERVEDIRTRKPADSKNEGYFLSELTNKLLEFLNRMGIEEKFPRVSSKNNIESLREIFNKTSAIFDKVYKDREKSTR